MKSKPKPTRKFWNCSHVGRRRISELADEFLSAEYQPKKNRLAESAAEFFAAVNPPKNGYPNKNRSFLCECDLAEMLLNNLNCAD